ncbi:RING finger protein nhl-1-like isoform X1 [Haliotis rufescens]|uniref:RING finger protein nhl-1-like isoform X1 n=2 Tax=Haliotis rufescens TaxID=6454 RepID=UPI001EB01CAA|nr:RING finger protein nhl-1-like isoform X1 [Haliotis rufescens]
MVRHKVTSASVLSMNEGELTYSSDQIEQLLQCSVCLDRYKTPKLLPCQHTFCHQPCLEGLVDHRLRTIRCPECRADHLVPRGGTANFPNNLTIISFLELSGHRRSTGIQFEEIQAIGSNVTAAIVPQGAGAVGGTGASSSGATSTSTSTNVGGATTCSECLRERNISRCSHCNDLLCDSCKRGHFDRYKNDVTRLISQIRRSLPNLSESLSGISSQGSQLQQRCETAKEELTEAIEKHIRELRNRHRELLGEIDSFILGELRSLRTHQENVEVEIASIASFCDSSEASMNRTSTPEAHIMEVKQQCLEHLESLRAVDSGRARAPVLRHLQIEMEGQYLTNTIDNFGEVIVTSGLSRNVPLPSQRSQDHTAPSAGAREVSENTEGLDRREGRATWQIPGSMDYSLRVAETRSPSVSPNLERRGAVARDSRLSRVSFEDHNVDEDGDRRILGNLSLPSSPLIEVRRRPRREHHSDTRIAGLLSGGDGLSIMERNRARHRSIGALPPPDEESLDGNSVSSDSPPRFAREQTFVRDSPARNATNQAPDGAWNRGSVRPAVRFDVAVNQSDDQSSGESSGNYSFSRANASPSMYVSSPRNKYNQKGHAILRFGERGNETGKFTWPRGVAVSRLDDNIYVADSSNHRVQVFAVDGRFLKTFGTYGQNEGEFDCLAGIAVNGLNQVIVSDRYNHRIQIFDRRGQCQSVFGVEGTGDGQLNYPWGIACDNMGFIYVCDKENHRIQVFQSNGTFVRKFGRFGQAPGQMENPHYVAVSSDNKVYVSDSSNHRIQVFNIYGDFLFTFGSNGTQRGQLKFPRGIAIDSQGFVVVADSGNNRIQVFRADGRFYTMFGSWGNENGQFKGLEGIAIQCNGNVIVSDRENHRIQVF